MLTPQATVDLWNECLDYARKHNLPPFCWKNSEAFINRVNGEFNMKPTPVKSSFIESTHYDNENNILYITFNNGTCTGHKDCPKQHHDGLIEGGGKYYHAHIKGRYEVE